MSLLRRATPDEQFAEVTRATVDLQVADELRAKLRRSYEREQPLVVKTGFDPNRPDLHLGHTLLLTRMRRFQDFGHEVVFLIGDFTGMIGDPSGKNVTRPALSREEVLANAETYKAQVFKVLDPERTKIRFNSEWLDALGTEGTVRLAAHWPLARMLERDDFKTRFREGRSISMHELLYPLFQGYDSVALKADVELGSTDQLFNLLVGRTLMREYGLEPQVILTGPILEGLDARMEDGRIVGEKMSKSLDNYVERGRAPVRDVRQADEHLRRPHVAVRRAALGAAAGRARCRAGPGGVGAAAPQGGEGGVRPGDGGPLPRRGGRGAGGRGVRRAASRAGRSTRRASPRWWWAPAGRRCRWSARSSTAQLVASTSEGRRLITQGAVKVDGARVSDPKAELPTGTHLVQVGKLRAARLTVR